MNKRIKGALAMVLAGAVTFSVTNNLLGDQAIKKIRKKVTTFANSGHQKTTHNIQLA
jgi:hypothetical protein